MQIETLGNFIVRVGSHEVQLGNRKSRAVIGYVALSDHPREARERLVGLLWSETEEEKARGSLRTTLHEIRGAFHAAGYDGLLTDKLQIALRPEGLDVDVKRVLEDARAGRAHRLLLERERLFEQLLPGSEDLDPAFRSWLLPKRQALQDRVLRDLEAAMRSSTMPQSQIEALARAILNLDPTHEEAARRLIQIRYDEGDLGGALGVYKRLWDVLADEYGEEPLPITKDLIATIKLAQDGGDGKALPKPASGPSRTLIHSGTATAAAARLIVSLGNFDAQPVPAENHYLVQEFRRELIASLVRFREWQVRDAPAGQHTHNAQSEHEVVLDGGAYQTETGVRLVLTLREPASGTYLWSEKLDISPKGWWASQQSVVQRMASALNVHISTGRMATIARKPETDLLAYDLWLRGQTTMMKFGIGDWHSALDLFSRSISLDPEFAPAYASLAQLNNGMHIAHFGIYRDERRRSDALRHARQAVDLAPTDSRCQLCLAWAYLMSKQFNSAGTHFELACDLNENDPWTMVSAGLGNAFAGNMIRANELASSALALSATPSSQVHGYAARIKALSEDYEAAWDHASKSVEAPALLAWKAIVLHYLDRNDVATRALEQFFDASRRQWCGTSPWTPEQSLSWFLTAFPIKEKNSWERLRLGLIGAKAPNCNLKFEDV